MSYVKEVERSSRKKRPSMKESNSENLYAKKGKTSMKQVRFG